MAWIKFDVFGRPMAVRRELGQWLLFQDSGTGLKTPVPDVMIPEELDESELAGYLAAIYHEYATDEVPEVILRS